jgi:hypothetical protein
MADPFVTNIPVDMNLAGGDFLSFFMGFALVFGIIFLVLYIYMALALMATGKRLNYKKPWMAWVPIANLVMMADLAQMPWWPILLILVSWIPFLGGLAGIAFAVFTIMWQWKICEKRNRPGWWPLLQMIPIIGTLWGLIMWGILAWGKD